jgi:DNA-binding GntR family transcriptional regulator
VADYDNLDRSRALQAYLLAIPTVNQAGMASRCANSDLTSKGPLVADIESGNAHEAEEAMRTHLRRIVSVIERAQESYPPSTPRSAAPLDHFRADRGSSSGSHEAP